MDIFEREAIGIRGRFGVDVWEKWLSFQHSQEDFLRNYGIREDRIDGTVLALKRLLRDEGIVADKNYHRANRKRASNPIFIRLLASRGVYGVGISGDIMAYVDLPIDENGTNFYWVVIDSNGDEIVGGPSSSFEEATSLAENNLFRLSRELYPETYTSRRSNRRVSSEQNPIDNIKVVDDGRGHAQIHVKSGNLTVFTIYERYNTENYYVMQIERLRNRTSSGVGSFLIYPTDFPYLWEFSHFNNSIRELVPDYLLDEMADELERIWQSSEFSDVTSSRRALPRRRPGRMANRRANRRPTRRSSRRRAYYNDYPESGGFFNYENPNYEYYTDREIEEGLRPQEFDGWSNRETQLAIDATSDLNVYLDVDNFAWNGTPDDIANYYLNNIDHSAYDLNMVNWEEIWEAMRDQ